VALAESDPWHLHGATSYDLLSFEGRGAGPGTVPLPGPEQTVFLINVAETEDAEATVNSLALAVEHVAANADGFRGSRLLTSVDGDAVVNLASWAGEKEFNAIFDDPEFTRRYGAFKETVTGAKYRLYRTSRVISPRR
jgi:heme-degrading monooxygenase HmoA